MSFHDYLSLSFPKQLLFIHVGNEVKSIHYHRAWICFWEQAYYATFRESVVIR
jgi:hypothetical protein